MHPDPSLLVAYLDGTLFHRDARDVDDHLAACRSCSDLLEAMQRVRAEEQRSKGTRVRMIGGAIATLLIAAIGGWFWLRPFTSPQPRETAPARVDATTATKRDVAPAAPQPVSPTPAAALEKPIAPATPRPAPPSKESPRKETRRTATTKAQASAIATKPPAKAATPKPEAARAAAVGVKPVVPAAAPSRIEGDVVLRGRRANAAVVWRTRDRTIEHSTDGGATWTTEYTAERSLRAGAFVDANVVWLVGESGLVLRRTKNGWFSASPPGDANLTAIRASSPSKASVTLEDGRVFSTANGGVTWSQTER